MRAIWSTGSDQAWILITNDERLDGHGYAQRNWQEQRFRDLKSGGWHWGDSRIHLPDHMERLLVILALAYGWLIALGSQAIAHNCAQTVRPRTDGTWRRQWSVFKEGLRYFYEYVQRYTVCLKLWFVPDKRFT